MEKACRRVVSASAIDNTGRRRPFKISPRGRRATDKREPRFHRKRGGVSTLGLTGIGEKHVKHRPGQIRRKIRTTQGQGRAGQKSRSSGESDQEPGAG